MSFVHGSNSSFSLGTAGTPATPVAITTFLSSVGFPMEVDAAEITTLSATAKSYIPGLENATISLEGRFHTTVHTQLAALRRVPNVAFVYGPAGTTTGLPRYTGNCILTNYEVSGGVDDAVGFTAELQVTGAVTIGVF